MARRARSKLKRRILEPQGLCLRYPSYREGQAAQLEAERRLGIAPSPSAAVSTGDSPAVRATTIPLRIFLKQEI